MVDENLYLKKDLEDYASLDSVEEPKYGSPSRGSLLQQALNLTDYELRSVRVGSYQGTLLFLFRKGGYVWLLKDSYGSCNLCDGLIGNPHPEEYAFSMMRNAYAFENVDDAKEFLGETDGYGWDRIRSDGLGTLEDLR